MSEGALCCRNGTVCNDKIVALAGGIPLAIAEAIIDGDSPQQIAQVELLVPWSLSCTHHAYVCAVTS